MLDGGNLEVLVGAALVLMLFHLASQLFLADLSTALDPLTGKGNRVADVLGEVGETSDFDAVLGILGLQIVGAFGIRAAQATGDLVFGMRTCRGKQHRDRECHGPGNFHFESPVARSELEEFQATAAPPAPSKIQHEQGPCADRKIRSELLNLEFPLQPLDLAPLSLELGGLIESRVAARRAMAAAISRLNVPRARLSD
ncbi:MAG: hypothetical protein ACRD3R_08025 [Terriglobales bacterium]